MLTLDEYYATNYSKCNLTYSFLATWKGLAYPTHVLQVIALPLQIFTFYIIWKYTPVAMKSMKRPLLINHSCCTVLDFLLCTMSTPYLFLHNMSIFGAGVFHWFGVSNEFQMATGAFSITSVASSYIYVYESRSHLLAMSRFRMAKKWKRIMYHLSIFIVLNLVFLFVLIIPENQNSAKLKVLEFDPCPTREYFRNDVLVLTDDLATARYVLWCHAPMLAMFMIFNGMFHFICTVYYLFVRPVNSLASETRRNQQKFFIGIVLQTSIPLLILLYFIFVVCMDGVTHTVTQELMNSSIIVFGMHGVLESVTILLVHRAYRHAVWKIVLERTGKR